MFSDVTILKGKILGIGDSPYPNVTALELSCPPQPGLTYHSVGINLGPSVVGKSVEIERATARRDDPKRHNPRLDYIVAVTVEDEEPCLTVYDDTRWVEIMKTTLRCREYDFPWNRGSWD